MHLNKSKIKILYWNANGIQTKLFVLYDFMCKNFVDICCISETHLKPTINLHSHPDFKIYRFDRTDVRLGGVLIFIRRALSHELLPSLNTELVENIGITVSGQRRKFQVFSCYVPGASTTTQIRSHFNNYLNKICRRNNAFFAVGDFNSKHRSWNCTRANLAVTTLFDNAADNQCFILHPHEPTHYPSDPNKSPSTIDLILTNGHQQITNPSTVCLGSDHNGVIFDIELNDEIPLTSLDLKPSYKDANWELYQRVVAEGIENERLHLSEINEPRQVDEIIEKLTETIHRAQSQAVPLKHRDKYSLELTDRIKSMIKIKSVLERQYLRSRSREHRLMIKLEINQLRRQIHTEISNLRNQNWNHKLARIHSGDGNKGLWQVCKFLKNKNRQLLPLKTENDILITAQEKSNALASQFSKMHENPLADNDHTFTERVQDEVENHVLSAVDPESINFPTTVEIVRHIKSFKNSKAPGLDRIHNINIKKLPYTGILYIKFIIYCCLKLSYFPKDWKQANVVSYPQTWKGSFKYLQLQTNISSYFT